MHSFPAIVWFLLPVLAFGASAATPDPAHNSRLSLDWPGTYRGILPCADCEGIETVITLMEDGTYIRSLRYLGRDDAYRRDHGRFEWNGAGSGIALAAGGQAYQVGENRLFHLDRDGQRIEGDLADRYVLAKDRRDPRLEGREWTLVALAGTLMACPDMTLAERFRELLNAPHLYSVDGADLVFSNQQGDTLARFREISALAR